MAIWQYTSQSALHTQMQTQKESETFKTHDYDRIKNPEGLIIDL